MIEAQASVSYHRFDCSPLPVELSISRFSGAGGVEEYHVTARPTQYGSAGAQMEWIRSAHERALASLGLDQATIVFKRFFCSDLTNQWTELQASGSSASALRSATEASAVSWVGQAPAPPAKVALWAYHVSDPSGALEKRTQGGSLLLGRGELTHIWTTGLTCANKWPMYHQTAGILRDYEAILDDRQMRLADNVIRTWFFARDVDMEYHGLVAARRDFFAERGLTADTHYIASTGIQGAAADSAARVMMDAYAIAGVRSEQIEFLSAPEHLSPTHIYGVTFERGVSVAYRDRKHVLISGTASIDSAGDIVHPGDVLRQLDRTVENVEALLKRAGAALADVCSLIVYVRDPSDLEAVQREARQWFGQAPAQVVVAPICRPGWLVEIECQAVVHDSSPTLPEF